MAVLGSHGPELHFRTLPRYHGFHPLRGSYDADVIILKFTDLSQICLKISNTSAAAESPSAAAGASETASASFPLLLEGELEEELLGVLVPQRPELALRLVHLTGWYLGIEMIKRGICEAGFGVFFFQKLRFSALC